VHTPIIFLEQASSRLDPAIIALRRIGQDYEDQDTRQRYRLRFIIAQGKA
jgi:hypothetical protein